MKTLLIILMLTLTACEVKVVPIDPRPYKVTLDTYHKGFEKWDIERYEGEWVHVCYLYLSSNPSPKEALKACKREIRYGYQLALSPVKTSAEALAFPGHV